MTKDPLTEATHAVTHAEEAKAKATEDTGEITALSNKLRTLRETNHFAELLRASLNGGKSS